MKIVDSGSGARMLSASVLVLCLSACASTPEADPVRDAEAKRFEPVTRDAVIYIYRPDRGSGAAQTTLWADGRLVGVSLPETFFRFIALPGKTLLHTSGPDNGRIEVNTRGNDVTYVEMRTDDDQSPMSRFRVVTADEARAAIRRCCTMLEVWRPGQPRLVW